MSNLVITTHPVFSLFPSLMWGFFPGARAHSCTILLWVLVTSLWDEGILALWDWKAKQSSPVASLSLDGYYEVWILAKISICKSEKIPVMKIMLKQTTVLLGLRGFYSLSWQNSTVLLLHFSLISPTTYFFSSLFFFVLFFLFSLLSLPLFIFISFLPLLVYFHSPTFLCLPLPFLPLWAFILLRLSPPQLH